jgi:hypothetical protein
LGTTSAFAYPPCPGRQVGMGVDPFPNAAQNLACFLTEGKVDVRVFAKLSLLFSARLCVTEVLSMVNLPGEEQWSGCR